MSAFLQMSNSTSSLSSAAAAAALRSHTTSPEPVGNLQTKRMVRRGSTSSNGSGMGSRGGGSRPDLQRSNSNGSMTERTFRASTEETDRRTMSLDSGAPPIPPIPANAHQRHNRTSSLEPPQRVTSPTHSVQSTDRVDSPPPTTSRQAKRLSNVTESEEADARPSSPTSPLRNFSRPMSPPLNASMPSGAAKKYTHGTGSWYTQPSSVNTHTRPMTADGISRPLGPPLDLSAVANRPISTHRISSAPGSHLARANSAQSRNVSGPSSMSDGGDDFETVYDKHTRTFIRRPRSQLVEPSSPESPQAGTVYDKNSRSFVPKRESTAFTVTPIQSDRVASPDQRPRIYRSAEPAEDPALLPPPRNPARLSPDSASPTSPRTPQILHKQPSVVREDPEAEQRAETLSPISNDPREISEATPAAAGPSKVYVAPATPHDRKASLDVPPQISSAGRERDKSASPSRSPHFSPSPIISAERHDPPPRGVSPVKSAMKHSPASSVRTASPIANFSPNVAPSTNTVSPSSEVSEGVSAQDVLDSSKKKKFVRVSFDEHAQEIQVADTATNTTAPDFDEEDDDAIMRPRPALPSFGSVRRTNMQPQLAEKVTEMPPERHDLSSDHAIGGILRSSLAPLPPEVTSKESSGYSSDDSSEMEVLAVASTANPDRAKAGAGLEPQIAGSDPIVKDFASAPVDRGAEHQEGDDDVPAINLLPPTPGIEDDSKKELSDQEDSFQARAKARNSVEIVVPGGWGEDDENEDESAASQALPNTTTQEASAATQTAMLKPNESPVLHASPQQLSDIDEDSDDSAEFSDAYEDPSDFEEGGFASLDAIVESPIVTPSLVEAKSKPRVLPAREPPESPTIQPVTRKTENADPSGGQNWGQTTAYWSQLSKEKREQMEKQHLSSDDDAAPAPKSTIARTTRNVQQAAAGSGLTAPPLSKAAKQTSSAQQEPTIRKTMRAQTGPAPTSAPAKADDGVNMRRSMRSGGGWTPSLRSGPAPRRPQSEYIEPKGTLQKKNIRPMSSTSVASSSSGSTMQTQRPSSASVPKSQDSSFPSFPTKTSAPQRRVEPPKVTTRLQKELARADDSDSESSFKRRRRANSGSTLESGGKYSMRRSMRGASIDENPTPAPAERRPQSPDLGSGSKSGFRLRSLSPPSLFGRKKTDTPPPPPPTITRTTLRSAPAPKSTGGKSAPPSRAYAPPAPRFESRFADSDDSDEEAAPSKSFRSRFVDSDDDEPAAPSGLTPVRGIPRKAGQYDGDSTDLEDSDEDRPGKQSKGRRQVTPVAQDPAEIEKAMAAARRNLGMSEEPPAKPKPVNEGSALAKGSLRNKPEPVKEDTPVLTPLEEVPTPITTPEKKRRGFMSNILRRNRNSSSSIQQIRPTSPPPPIPSSPTVKTSPVGNEQTATNSTSSPTGGKLIRRQSDQPQIARVNSDYSTATAPPISDTTTAVATQNDEDWPLPSPPIPPVPPIPADLQGNVARPTTSEGFSPEPVKLARTMRPDLTPRSKSGPQHRVRIQAGEEGSEPGEREKDMKAVYSRRTGKKKKFGMLRRAFGIDD